MEIPFQLERNIKTYRNYSSSSSSTTRTHSFRNPKYKKSFITAIIKCTISKHNSTLEIYNKNVITGIIYDDKKHIVSIFKNYLLWDETSEFLRRYYYKNESTNRIPKIGGYYEKYTLFAPVYGGFNENIVHIMKRYVRRKKKYLDYIEETEEKKDTQSKHKNIHTSKHINQFEQLIKPDMLEITSKPKNENTVDLTIYNTIPSKQNINSNKSFCSLINDTSSHYCLIPKENIPNTTSHSKPLSSLTVTSSLPTKLPSTQPSTSKHATYTTSKVLLRPKNITKLNLEGLIHINNNNNNLIPLSYNNSARKFSSKGFTSRKEKTVYSKQRLVLKELPFTKMKGSVSNSQNRRCNYSSRNTRQSSTNLDYYCNRETVISRRRNTKLMKNNGEGSGIKGKKKLILGNVNKNGWNENGYPYIRTEGQCVREGNVKMKEKESRKSCSNGRIVAKLGYGLCHVGKGKKEIMGKGKKVG